MLLQFLLPLCISAGALAARVRIEIRPVDSKFTGFTPASTRAAVGDYVDFYFTEDNSVLSIFLGQDGQPCTPNINSALFFSSGPVLGNSIENRVFSVEVKSKKQMTVSRSIGGKCQDDMFAVINPSFNNKLESSSGNRSPKQVAMIAPPILYGGSLSLKSVEGPHEIRRRGLKDLFSEGASALIAAATATRPATTATVTALAPAATTIIETVPAQSAAPSAAVQTSSAAIPTPSSSSDTTVIVLVTSTQVPTGAPPQTTVTVTG